MKKSIILILFLSTAFLFTNCKKYEEGPNLITLRSVKNRLTNGKWLLQEFKVDGIDSTEAYNEITFKLTIEKNSNSSVNYGYALYSYVLNYTYLGQEQNTYGELNFYEDGDYIQFINYNYDYYYYPGAYPTIFYPYYSDDAAYWEIKKLTNKEFWIECIYNNGMKYSIKLKKSK